MQKIKTTYFSLLSLDQLVGGQMKEAANYVNMIPMLAADNTKKVPPFIACSKRSFYVNAYHFNFVLVKKRIEILGVPIRSNKNNFRSSMTVWRRLFSFKLNPKNNRR